MVKSVKDYKNITGINTKITLLADKIQIARMKIISNNCNINLSKEDTRRIILICLLFLRTNNKYTNIESITLFEILTELKITKSNTFNISEKIDIHNIQISETLNELSSINDDSDWCNLINYAIEALEYDVNDYFKTNITRGTRSANIKKKKHGIYYTPVDVVDFIVSQCFSSLLPTNTTPSVLDCSCGSGVFLLNSFIRLNDINNSKHDFETSIYILKKCIWGIDISQAAIDCCKTVFLQYYIDTYTEAKNQLDYVLEALDSSIFVGDSTDLQSVIDFHKELPSCFDCILGNPPYVTINKNSNLFISFVENMILYSSQISCSALILPLSICYSQGKEYIKIRDKIKSDNSKWIFMNYDRSPDSLFGDQVKTRNTILFRNCITKDKSVFTTKLQRWTSERRNDLFNNYKLCDISNIQLSKIVPKISCQEEKKVFDILNNKTSNLKELFSSCSSKYNLVVSGTAYNWICAYNHIPKSTDEYGNEYLSKTTKIYYLPDEESRDFCIALLNNRIAYWYWLSIGDGFHLNASFLSDYCISKNDFTIFQYKELCKLGKMYSQKIKEYPIISYNAGKRIVNYSHWYAEDIIQSIEKIIIDALNLPNEFCSYIEQWYSNQVYCDRKNEKR